MRFLDAALLVLADADRPLTTRGLTDVAMARGLIQSRGKTPEATMAAALYLEANRPTSRIRKISQPGPQRAVRGSVRWMLADR